MFPVYALVKGLNIAIKGEVKSSSQDPGTPQKNRTRAASMFGSGSPSKKLKLGDEKTLALESVEQTTGQVLSYYSMDSMW